MSSYIFQRFIRTLFTFIIFETLVFFFIKAIPGEEFTIKPPKPVVVDQEIASVTQEGQQTATTPTAQLVQQPQSTPGIKPPPKWLPEEDKESYYKDAALDLVLQGAPTEESQPVGNVSDETPGQGDQTTSTESAITNPTEVQQFGFWMQGLLKGDLGISSKRRKPVTEVLAELAPRTLILILPGALIGFYLGLRLGTIISWKRGGKQEFSTTVAGVALFTAFPPFLSFVLASVFAFYLNWLPRENIITPELWLGEPVLPNTIITWMLITLVIDAVIFYFVWRTTRWMIGRRRILRLTGTIIVVALTFGWWIGRGFAPFAWDIIIHLVLPLTTLILLTFGTTMLLMRASMTEVLQDAHVVTAKAKGLPDSKVVNQHVARLALIPVVSRFVLELPLVIISSFAIERVFFWNGLGQFLFEAANESDYALVLGILTVVGIVILAAHLFVDLLNLVLDPRLRKTVMMVSEG